MIIVGTATVNKKSYRTFIWNERDNIEVQLTNLENQIVSAYKVENSNEKIYGNIDAKDIGRAIIKGRRKCTSKNGYPVPFVYGAVNQHEFKLDGRQYVMQLYTRELAYVSIESNDFKVEAEFRENVALCNEVNYVDVTKTNTTRVAETELDLIPTRSVEEIAIEKNDVSWLKSKNYYIVNDDETAEKLIEWLENYNGLIAYDTETTGLFINCFGMIGSKYKKKLEEYNKEHPEDKIRADKLVGVIFCVEDDTSYYFPCANRKFKNLYEKGSKYRDINIQNTKMKYTIGEFRNETNCIAEYWRNTPDDEITSDCIFMERVRKILETKHIGGHNGSFDCKVGYQYGIDVNLQDDSMIMHQIMYKFRNGSGKSESSSLKHLTLVEFGVEQWELSDFFPNWKPNKEGLVRNKPGAKFRLENNIDFSYMDYKGTRIYAPADGDFTFKLINKYKADMIANHKDMMYLYRIEINVAMAIAYMEFYGHRIDESKIEEARATTNAECKIYELEFRKQAGIGNAEEDALKDKLNQLLNDNCISNEEKIKQLDKASEQAKEIMENSEEKLLLSSPQQVSELFFKKLGYPDYNGDGSVANKVVGRLCKEKDENGNDKYPLANIYKSYKSKYTLLTKFFDNLRYFMYPGGFIFSSYGQIETNTGRMTCSKPNAQQYPKSITKIIIPREGYVMVDADYSQIEYRVLTAMAGNDWLAELFSNPDSDYHTLMASLMYEVDYSAVTPQMRSAAKSFNFGIPYGMGFGSLAILLTGRNTPETRLEAKQKYDDYFKNQPKTKQFFNNVKEMAQVRGYTKTLFGRVRNYNFLDSSGEVNNAKVASALRQAGNAVIQGTAADIFKIGVARNFAFIKKNKLFGKVLIVNMIHDEQLIEIDAQSLNVQKVLAEIGKNMQFKIDGFPPLFIGAGVGKAWGYAKGKQAEIHPKLLDEMTREAENMPLFVNNTEPVDTNKIVEQFNNRVVEFRRQMVAQYLQNSENWGKEIYPAIASIVNLQFNYGRGDSAKNYKDENGNTLTDKEFLMLNIGDFIKENNLNVDINNFVIAESQGYEEDEEDEEYSDDDEIDEDGTIFDDSKEFRIVNEDDKTYGSSIEDLLNSFDVVLLKGGKRICGINTKGITYSQNSNLAEYLSTRICDSEDDGAVQIVFLNANNIVKYTGVYVQSADIDANVIKSIITNKKTNYSDYTEGDVNNRSNAK